MKSDTIRLPKGMVAISRDTLGAIISAATSAQGCAASAPAHVEEMLETALADLNAVHAGRPHGSEPLLPLAA